ncbi:MAG: hypothetical protein AAF078_05755 [Planctomycetota bacterium]
MSYVFMAARYWRTYEGFVVSDAGLVADFETDHEREIRYQIRLPGGGHPAELPVVVGQLDPSCCAGEGSTASETIE